MIDADRLIATLGLQRHPEGGWFREIYRHVAADGGRGALTAIYYLLKDGERSHWHRIDADEVWSFHLGDPLALSISPDGHTSSTQILGGDVAASQRPQIIVPARHWQAAKPLGRYCLVGCTVAPAFEFSCFEMAPKGWDPEDRSFA